MPLPDNCRRFPPSTQVTRLCWYFNASCLYRSGVGQSCQSTAAAVLPTCSYSYTRIRQSFNLKACNWPLEQSTRFAAPHPRLAMKKIIAKVKDHAHSSHHSTNDDDGHSEDNGLRASLYEDTSSQAPPRLGTTPIKGDNYEPPSQLHASPLVAAPASASTSAPAHLAASASSYQPQANPQLERQQPVNFSRLPVGRVDRL